MFSSKVGCVYPIVLIVVFAVVFFATQFYDCGDNLDYVSLRSMNVINGNSYYLANLERGPGRLDPVDLVVIYTSLIP